MIIGIDIGTSVSRAAVLRDRDAIPFRPDQETGCLIPSVAYIRDNDLLIGSDASHWYLGDPSCYVEGFKKDLGVKASPFTANTAHTVEGIYQRFFALFRESVENAFGEMILKAYITHPADYTKEQQAILIKAANAAGIPETELIDEFTACVLRFIPLYTIRPGEKLLVYDLGGSAFHAAIMEMTDEAPRFLAKSGALEGGGEDLDQLLYDEIVKRLSAQHDLGNALEKPRFRSLLRIGRAHV